MGKAEIISNKDLGLYRAKILYNRTAYNAEISRLQYSIAYYENLIATLEDGAVKTANKLQKLSCEKRLNYLRNHMPEDYKVDVWCVDYSTNISIGTIVGTIEVPGEIGDLNIQGGYEDNCNYVQSRDGQMTPPVTLSTASIYYNLAILPGWQKWKPTFRYGTILSFNLDDTCNVGIHQASSSAQNLSLNKVTKLESVPIEYMNCNRAAFVENDIVVVKFEGQSWDSPKVIGFKEEPRPCAEKLLFRYKDSNYSYDRCIIWDAETGTYAANVVKDDESVVSIWPVDYSDISNWLTTHTESTDAEDLLTKSAISDRDLSNNNGFGKGIGILNWNDTITVTNATYSIPGRGDLQDSLTCTNVDNSYRSGIWWVVENWQDSETTKQTCGFRTSIHPDDGNANLAPLACLQWGFPQQYNVYSKVDSNNKHSFISTFVHTIDYESWLKTNINDGTPGDASQTGVFEGRLQLKTPYGDLGNEIEIDSGVTTDDTVTKITSWEMQRLSSSLGGVLHTKSPKMGMHLYFFGYIKSDMTFKSVVQNASGGYPLIFSFEPDTCYYSEEGPAFSDFEETMNTPIFLCHAAIGKLPDFDPEQDNPFLLDRDNNLENALIALGDNYVSVTGSDSLSNSFLNLEVRI
jgi:hypothetical protein